MREPPKLENAAIQEALRTYYDLLDVALTSLVCGLSMRKVTYPFIPKSTAHLEPGQFWSIPLNNGRFACGRVMQLAFWGGKKDTRWFLAGLANWVGKEPPSATSIAGCVVMAQGAAHIGVIRDYQGLILGHRSLEEDGLEPQTFRSQESLALNCMLMHGLAEVRPATYEEQALYPVLSFWYDGYVKYLAERYFGA